MCNIRMQDVEVERTTGEWEIVLLLQDRPAWFFPHAALL